MRPNAWSAVPAPSSTLLKFLRSQSKAVCCVTVNSRPGPSYRLSNRSTLASTTGCQASSRVRGLRTTTRSAATTIQPSSGNLDELVDRARSIGSSLHAPFLHPPFRRRWSCSTPQGRRHLSGSHSWRQSLLNLARKARKKDAWKLDDLPPIASILGDGTDSSMLSLGRISPNKAANELKLRCTEFDEHGNVTLVNGEFKKSELIAKYGLLPRDLRKIDSSLFPNILVRESAILINLLHIRALVKSDRVLVFDVYGSTDSYIQSNFMYDLEGKLRQKEASRQAGGLPYEFRALEAMLISVTSALESEFDGVRGPVVRVLRELEEDIDRDKLRYLLVYSKKLGTFEQKAKLVRDAIDELLDADDDLAAMYLGEKAKGGGRGEEDHREVEMLLENYHKVCDEIVQVGGNLISNIRNTEEIVKAILDSNRNSLMLLDLKFSIGTLGIGSGAFIAALYGMNLKNFMEEAELGFIGVTGLSCVFAGIICSYGLTKLRKVQRVTMWGESGRGKRGSWRDVESGSAASLPSLAQAGGLGPDGLGSADGRRDGEKEKEVERKRFYEARGDRSGNGNGNIDPLAVIKRG